MPLQGIGSTIAAELIAYDHLIQATEAAGQERASGNAILTAGAGQPARIAAFSRFAVARDALLKNFRSMQSDDVRPAWASARNSAAITASEVACDRILTGDTLPHAGQGADRWRVKQMHNSYAFHLRHKK